MKIKNILLSTFTLFVLTINITFAQGKSQCFINEHNIAINGYDAVSYHMDNKAVKGSEEYKVTFDNASFYFVSAKNKTLFEKNPMKYLPQYGGFCAFGIGAKNTKVPSNPETFEVVDGKLYLFFNDMYEGKKMNTKMMWDKDRAKFNTLADANWKKILEKAHK